VELPLLAPFDIDTLGLRLVDQRLLPVEAQHRATEIFCELLQKQFLDAMRPGVAICGSEQFDYENERYFEALKSRPGLLRHEFLEELGDAVVVAESMPDPRLASLSFVVFDAAPEDESVRSVLGRFDCYNIKVERDEARRLTATAMPAPGCRAAPGRTLIRTWVDIMRAILSEDLSFRGGALDFIGWDFPTNPDHKWSGSEEVDGVTAQRLVDQASAGHDVARRPDGTPLAIRRRASRAVR
jgi:hypothetical protein